MERPERTAKGVRTQRVLSRLVAGYTSLAVLVFVAWWAAAGSPPWTGAIALAAPALTLGAWAAVLPTLERRQGRPESGTETTAPDGSRPSRRGGWWSILLGAALGAAAFVVAGGEDHNAGAIFLLLLLLLSVRQFVGPMLKDWIADRFR